MAFNFRDNAAENAKNARYKQLEKFKNEKNKKKERGLCMRNAKQTKWNAKSKTLNILKTININEMVKEDRKKKYLIVDAKIITIMNSIKNNCDKSKIKDIIEKIIVEAIKKKCFQECYTGLMISFLHYIYLQSQIDKMENQYFLFKLRSLYIVDSDSIENDQYNAAKYFKEYIGCSCPKLCRKCRECNWGRNNDMMADMIFISRCIICTPNMEHETRGLTCVCLKANKIKNKMELTKTKKNHPIGICLSCIETMYKLIKMETMPKPAWKLFIHLLILQQRQKLIIDVKLNKNETDKLTEQWQGTKEKTVAFNYGDEFCVKQWPCTIHLHEINNDFKSDKKRRKQYVQLKTISYLTKTKEEIEQKINKHSPIYVMNEEPFCGSMVNADDGYRYYQIDWKGYTVNDRTWEHEDNIIDKNILNKYKRNIINIRNNKNASNITFTCDKVLLASSFPMAKIKSKIKITNTAGEYHTLLFVKYDNTNDYIVIDVNKENDQKSEDELIEYISSKTNIKRGNIKFISININDYGICNQLCIFMTKILLNATTGIKYKSINKFIMNTLYNVVDTYKELKQHLNKFTNDRENKELIDIYKSILIKYDKSSNDD